MDKDTKKVYYSAINNLLNGINENYHKWYGSGKRNIDRSKKDLPLAIVAGRKFDKIVESNRVWGFVAKKDGMLKGIPYRVGDVFKPAGWKAPAKHVRGSIFSNSIDWYSWTGPNYLI